MPKPRLKGHSRRMTTKKASKITKKVREHKRKMRKLQKHNPTKVGIQTRIKKEASLPNIMPFKERILKEAEDDVTAREEAKNRKFRLLNERMKEKEENKQIMRSLTRKEKMDLMMQRAMVPGGLAKREAQLPPLADRVAKVMKKTEQPKQATKMFYKDFKEVVKEADIILEVLDARDPLGSRCAELENYITDSGPHKRLVLLLNKIDLIPRQNLLDWLKYLRNEYPTLPFKASTQLQRTNLKQQKGKATKLPEKALKMRGCVGGDKLMQLFGNYCRNKDIKSKITIGVVGFPNTGKSSVINSLKRSRSCLVGAIPGITKSVQRITLDKHTWLLDSPGLVMSRDMSSVGAILHNCVDVNKIEDPIPPVEAILKRCNKEQMMQRYMIPDYTDSQNFLQLVAKRYGYLIQGGVPDAIRAGKQILQEWNVGRIRYFTHPPTRTVHQPHEKAEILNVLSKPFDLDALYKDEELDFTAKKSKGKGKAMLISDVPQSADGDISRLDTLIDESEQSAANKVESMDSTEGNASASSEAMDLERDSMTVQLPNNKKSTDMAEAVHKDPDSLLAGNQKSNKQVKKNFKKFQKERKRQDMVASFLSEALNTALPSANS